MRSSLRYTLARLTLFLACLLAGWLLGLRHDPFLLVLAAATVSMFLSIFVLRGMREQFSRDVAQQVEARVERKRERSARRRADEVLDDHEAEDRATGAAPDDPYRA